MSGDTIFKQDGITIAGGNGRGNQLNQLNFPWSVHVDDNNQIIYIAESENHRVVEWKYGAKSGQVVAGGNGGGTRMDQLYRPAYVTVDQINDCLIISDYGNRRVVRWSRQNNTNQEIIISDIDCLGLTLDNNGNLYVCDYKKNEGQSRSAVNGRALTNYGVKDFMRFISFQETDFTIKIHKTDLY